jgi:hypothetical protein
MFVVRYSVRRMLHSVKVSQTVGQIFLISNVGLKIVRQILIFRIWIHNKI